MLLKLRCVNTEHRLTWKWDILEIFSFTCLLCAEKCLMFVYLLTYIYILAPICIGNYLGAQNTGLGFHKSNQVSGRGTNKSSWITWLSSSLWETEAHVNVKTLMLQLVTLTCWSSASSKLGVSRDALQYFDHTPWNTLLSFCPLVQPATTQTALRY